jgi:hypothetical protein
MKLVPFTTQDGIEIHIDTETGASYASLSATARMCSTNDKEVQPTQIKRLIESNGFETVTKTPLLEAEVHTTTGLKTVTFLDEKQILGCLVKYNPNLLINFAEVGIRVYLHKLAGYEVTSTATQPQPQPRQLPPVRDAVDYVNATATIKGLGSSIPHALQQLLLDRLGDELHTLKQGVLPESKERWLGVAQLAEELGYKLTAGEGSSLGKYAAKQPGVERKQEERLCNGQIRKINVYLETPALETVIHDYFSLKRLMVTDK